LLGPALLYNQPTTRNHGPNSKIKDLIIEDVFGQKEHDQLPIVLA
jgi:hypothetical protein